MFKYMFDKVCYISLSLILSYFKHRVYNQLEKQSENKIFSKQLVSDCTPALFAAFGCLT